MNNTIYTELVSKYKDEALATLKELVAIPSVYDEKTKDEKNPFGKNVSAALDYVYKLGKKLGFEATNYDNYVVELTHGEGKTLDIYAHVDVVSVTASDWTSDPFIVRIADNILYGRGVADDKGPGIACLYALKALLDSGELNGYKVRFIFGGNEERDSLCLEHYFHTLKKEYPTLGFSPDSDYPLIYGEKSIYAYKARYDLNIDVKDFIWGEALNIVLDRCQVTLLSKVSEAQKLLPEFLAKYPEVKGKIEGDVISFYGVPSHGSKPWDGVNAGLYLLLFLGYLFDDKRARDVFAHYSSGKGESIHLNYQDETFTESSYNAGKMEYKDGVLDVYINARFPSSLDVNKVIEDVRNETGAIITLLGGSTGFVVPKDKPLVKILLKSYQEESGDYQSEPLAIGGGTYARESKNSVAFGAQFPNQDYKMHGIDEFFPLDVFYANMQIYAHAIKELGDYLKSL